ncbi:diadenylate cyclase CdaA [Salisediminibacterium selenitireducens]|uniref:Diadenylate cyclase n=1 Tax=Bacillus selenitireducens (strain ATCC 700615 / DSM 15326 / MLS10) TaxID=439292 RepID=D6XWS0_BACIE|nr:diadenylate cyclase CdaA [Salisediminibacterium selenitireducens]ADH97912.1 protein of unknown function DUF147 [[Bacillus] selenitireducens MLS10]
MFEDLTFWRLVAIVVDITLVAFVIYKLIMVIRGTRAVQLVKGITVILTVWFLSGYFGLHTLQWLMQQAVIYGVLAIIIIFQPELRRALEHLGRGKLFQSSSTANAEEIEEMIEHLIKSTNYMGKRRIGALISIERETGMNDYIETGVKLNANLTTELMTNIFIPNAPLHDGAVVLQNGSIAAAGCYLPLSENPFISKELGTRHRAALGVSEVTDALTLVVSEETGAISMTKNGELHRNLDQDHLRKMLEKELMNKEEDKGTSRWQWGGRNNG